MSTALRLVTPNNENRQVGLNSLVIARVMPSRPRNAELRPREYLTVAEVERLMKAAKSGRYGHRDATLILIAFRHGLRAVEIASCNGRKSSSAATPPCMSPGSRTGRHRFTRCRVTNCGHCVSYNASSPIAAMCSPPSAAGRFTPDAINLLVKTIGKRAGLPFRSTSTCCGTPAATRWPMQGTIRGASSRGSGTGAFSTRCAIPS